MSHTITHALQTRVSTSEFLPGLTLDDSDIKRLIAKATLAPSAFNLQNWRFLAVRDAEARRRLQGVAYGQEKISQAAVVFIVCGTLNAHHQLAAMLEPAVLNHSLPRSVADSWIGWARVTHEGSPALQRDEAIRSASLAAMTLMLAAQAEGLASCAMSGFDPEGVCRQFGLDPDTLPVMLIAVGQARHDGERQKPRRPVADVLQII